MADGTAKPVIFISYSHKDEPEHPRDGEVQWLSFVRTYLQPAIKNGIFDLFVDEHLSGGDDLKPEIDKSCVRATFSFRSSLRIRRPPITSSIPRYDRRERVANGDDICFYPVILTPTPKIALDKFKDKVIRPDDAKPLSSFPYGERLQKMTDIADEIANIAAEIVGRKPEPPKRGPQPSYVHIAGLPETPYERLVGRDDELKRLDEAWSDAKTNILSLIAEGGAGKSALVNEWLKRLQADNYRGAEAVLGWSFYSQGSKERATSADEFLNWALEKLGIKLETTSASAKGEAIAEELIKRRVLLVLDGVEPLQHGLDTQLGQLKDQGIRALLRRFAATPPGEAHGLIVLTSRLAVKDIARWQDGAAPVVDVDRLSDEAGAALLRDNGVWGTDKVLKAAHTTSAAIRSRSACSRASSRRRRPAMCAGVTTSAPISPIRKIRATTTPKRVMESCEKEWLAGQPVLLAIMHMVGLFDRPASGDCLKALRAKPAIEGLTDQIVGIGEDEWQRAIARLREVRLLAPPDPAALYALDAHPLVREWFGDRLRQTNESAWKAAHGRLYEHLRDATKEGDAPTLEDLAPLYQAVADGCRAGRYEEALNKIYIDRICRPRPDGRLEFYARNKLGAAGSGLAAMSWFFDRPYATPVPALGPAAQAWVLAEAAFSLRPQGRFAEALPAMRLALRMADNAHRWESAAAYASDQSEAELLAGAVATAIATAEKSVALAGRGSDEFQMISGREKYAECPARRRPAQGGCASVCRLRAAAERMAILLSADLCGWGLSILRTVAGRGLSKRCS